MTNREFLNNEKRIRRAAAKEGYSIQRKRVRDKLTGSIIIEGYNVSDANNVICNAGNYEMDIYDVAERFGVEIKESKS